MNKKFIKLFAASALAFFASTTLVNAKTYTSLDALTKDVETWKENETGEEDTVGYIFIIGEHVFTSNYVESINDLISYATAWQTIPTSSKPYIIEIDKYSDGWNLETQTNLFNNGVTLPETLNIQYVDMERFGDKVATNYDVNTFVDVANTHVNNTENTEIYGKYELNFDETTGKVTFTAIDPNLQIESIKNSGIIAELSRILATGNYTEIKITDLADSTKTVSLNANATTETIATEINKLVNGSTSLADLTNKKFNVELVLAEEKIPEDNNLSEFEIDFVSIAKTNKYFENSNGGAIYKLSCISSEDSEKCNVVINILNSSANINASQNGLDVLATIIKNALNSKLVESVNLQLGNTYKTLEYSEVKDGLVNDIRNYLDIVADTYADLTKENFGDIVIKFNLKDGVISNYDSNVRTEEYKFEIGEYVNTDDIVDQIVNENNKSNLGSVSDSNEFYNLSREGNKLIFNVNLQSNGELYRFQTVTNGLEKIIYDSSNGVIKNNEQISKIVVIDNNTNNEYELKTGKESGNTLTEILATILGVTSANGTKVSPSMLKNLDISIRFEIATDKELIPGLNGYGVYTKDSQYATYDASFKINGFNVKDMITKGFKNDEYLTLIETDEENVYDLNVTLKDVNTTLEEADLLGKLGWYVGLFKSITITVDEQEPVELDLSDVDAARKTIDEVLKLTDSSTLEDLYNKEFTLQLVLADDVNLKLPKTFDDNTNRVTDYTVNVKLTYAKEIVADSNSIQSALDNDPQVIELDENGTYGASLTIGNNNNKNDNIVINGNGATITGDVIVKANNVTFNNVNITGKLSIPEEGYADKVDEITIKGNGNTTITGAIDIKNNANVTIEGMKIVGTNKEIGVLDTGNVAKHAVISSTGTGKFTLKGSEVSYTGGKGIPENGSNTDTYVYSLVYIDGNAEITGNTFNITNVKNPIEYKYNANNATSIVIDGNKFTGSNYVKGDAHNVISFYGAAEGSVIEVTNNTFEYANWAVRISNPTSSTNVKYIITGNKVTKNTFEEIKPERNPLALVGVQEISSGDLKNITIVYDENTAEGYLDYKVDELPYHTSESLEKGESALIYAYKKNGDITDNLPHLQTYEEYLEEQNKVQE